MRRIYRSFSPHDARRDLRLQRHYRPYNRQTSAYRNKIRNLQSDFRSAQYWGSNGSDAEDTAALFDFFDRIELPAATAGADFAGGLPRFGRAEIRIPEGPGSALTRTGLIDLAFSCFGVEENTVAVREFLQAFADTDFPHIEPFELVDILVAF